MIPALLLRVSQCHVLATALVCVTVACSVTASPTIDSATGDAYKQAACLLSTVNGILQNIIMVVVIAS